MGITNRPGAGHRYAICDLPRRSPEAEGSQPSGGTKAGRFTREGDGRKAFLPINGMSKFHAERSASEKLSRLQ
jgi:hypothetical protein